MPLVKVHLYSHEGETPEILTEVRYDSETTLLQFRRTVDQMQAVSGPYQYWSASLGHRVPEYAEKINRVGDYPEIFLILDRLLRDPVAAASPHAVNPFPSGAPECPGQRTTLPPSSNYEPSFHDTDETQSDWEGHITDAAEDIPSDDFDRRCSLDDVDLESDRELDPTAENSNVSNFRVMMQEPWWPVKRSLPKGGSIESRIEMLSDSSCKLHGSSAMPSEVLKIWNASIDKFANAMAKRTTESHRWVAITWDELNGSAKVPQAALVCCECRYLAPVTRARIPVTKAAILACFTNFRSKHLITEKHLKALRRKAEAAANVEREVEPTANSQPTVEINGNRKKVNDGLDILSNINALVGPNARGGETFFLRGDAQAEPCDPSKLFVLCSSCSHFLYALCPEKNTLGHNLKQHAKSKLHKEKSSIAPSGVTESSRGSTAILSGGAGRPKRPDGRDRGQKVIHSFFRNQSSSTSNRGKESGIDLLTDPSLSRLCWGYWRREWKGRNVSVLLHDRTPGGVWRVEPNTSGVVWNSVSGEVIPFDGTFRHVECSRTSVAGGGFEDLMCTHCFSIPAQNDFRKRTEREAASENCRGTRSTSNGTRLTYLTDSEMQNVSRDLSDRNTRLSRKVKSLQSIVTRLRYKPCSLKQIIGDAVDSKDTVKFCSAVINAQRHGAFGGKPALWDFVKDLVFNLCREKSGHRYSENTKSIMQALYHHGGRRVIDCFYANLGGPSLSTLQKARRSMVDFRSGLHASQFEFIARVYEIAKQKAGIVGDVPVILAEDETAVKQSIRWLQKSDVLVGFCGCREGHKCSAGFEIVVGEGQSGFENIENAFKNCVKGRVARVIIVNPLADGLPRLCLMASCSCNRFDAQYVRQEWSDLRHMWNKYCRARVGPVIGHASDGDPRRRKLMLDDFVGRCISGPRVTVGWEGWSFGYSMVWNDVLRKREPYGLHDQDYIHNAKKLINAVDSATRICKLGDSEATIDQVDMIYRTYDDHGLTLEDVKRADRQNFASAQRLCSRKVIDCLRRLRTREDEEYEMCIGTESYLSIVADYLDIFLNERKTVRERIVLCSKVSFFFRLWRLWIKRGDTSVGGNRQSLTLENMVSSQTFADVQMSCQYVVHLVMLFRDSYPDLELPFHLTGSDSCEQFFSKVGGMKGHERNYDFAELLSAACQLNRLGQIGMLESLVSTGDSKKKFRNIWMQLHKMSAGEVVADLKDYSEVRTNEMVIEALKEGFAAAQDMCTMLQMCPLVGGIRGDWWDSPWTAEKDFGFADFVPQSADGDDSDDDMVGVHPTEAVATETTPVIPTMVDVVGTAVGGAGFVADADPDADPDADTTWDDELSDEAVFAGEMEHAMQELVDDTLADDGEDSHGSRSETPSETRKAISPFVEFEGKRMWKGTVVSSFNGNPQLSKDRLMKVRESFYYNNQTEVTDADGEDVIMVGIGTDVGVQFIDSAAPPRSPPRKARKGPWKGPGKRSAASTSSSLRAPRRRGKPKSVIHFDPAPGDEKLWYIGRIQRIRRKYQGKWGRGRQPVNLLNPPKAPNGESGSVCQFLLHWYRQHGSSRESYKYDVVDLQWIDVSCIIGAVTMTMHPSLPKVFQVDPTHLKLLDADVARARTDL